MTVQQTIVNKQYKISINIIEDANTFLKYLHKAYWPENMNAIRDNLLRSTILDEEIMSISGNSHTVLQSVKAALKICYTKTFFELDLRWEQVVQAHSNKITSNTDKVDAPTSKPNVNDQLT